MINERRNRRAGIKAMLVMTMAAIGLGGCGDMHVVGDPIGVFRDMTGASAADAKDKAPNAGNLAEGDKQPYPNLASVPKTPDAAITKADRDRLAKSLLADRQNAQYTDEKLHAGQNMAAIPPPAPAPPEEPKPKVAAAPASTHSPAPKKAPPSKVAAAPVGPVKQETLAPPAPTPKVAAAPATPAPAPAPELKPAPQVAAVPAPTPAPPKPSAQQATMTPIVDKKDIDQRKQERAEKKTVEKKSDKKADKADRKPDDSKKRQAKVKRGSEPPPDESSLRPPSVGDLPVGEEAHEAPPQPAGTPRSARASPSEEVAAAAPPGDAEPAARRGKGQTKEIRFSPGPFRAKILPADHKQLVEVAQLVERNHGRVRVVGYGGAPAAGDPAQREFQSFNAALDNAKAVGVALAKLGVPPSKIDIETASAVNSPDRAEVFVEY